jgi:hypothetical protein
MYDFIYSFFVRLFEKVGTVDPKDNAASILLIVIFFHAFLLITSITYFTGLNLLTVAYGENHSKYLWLPVIVFVMVLMYRTYKKRSDVALAKYVEANLLSPINIALVLCISIGPLLLGILFLNIQ